MTAIPLFDTAELEPLLAAGWLALTPNRRLASRIRNAIVSRAGSRGSVVVSTPPVLALADWLAQLWTQLCFIDVDACDHRLLDDDQERVLWQQVVGESDGSVLLRPTDAAKQAQAAYRTLALWRQLPLRRDVAAEFEFTEEGRLFHGWLVEFEQRCQQLGAISVVERDRRLLQAAERGVLALPAAVVTVAFDELTPLHRALFDCLPASRALPTSERNQSTAALGCDDLTTQLQSAARWARQRLQQSPTESIAIVVPQLAQQRDVVERILRNTFEPAHAAPDASHRPPPFNISAGIALSDLPLVATALQLLALTRRELARDQLLSLLDTPFHGFGESVDAIASAVEALCELRSDRIDGAQLRAIAAKVAESYPHWSLSSRLQQLHDSVRREKLSQIRLTPTEWRDHFDAMLAQLGWPGTRPLDSIEYQQQRLWLRALDDFARLDLILGAIGLETALAALQEVLGARPFQPETPDASLQVLGLLEAAGLQFDGIWLCEMGEDLWPPAASPNPLLPRELQRRLAMPHCDASRELQFANQLTASLINASRDVVVCYQQQRDDVARRPSPLFGRLPALQLPAWDTAPALPFMLETFAPGVAPTLSGQTRNRGGSGILASQSACPFQAFARYRLGGRGLDASVEGLDASERGVLLHGALEKIWRELGGSAALAAIDSAALAALIADAAGTTIMALRQRIPGRLGARFAALEQQRLAALLQEWLLLERERPSFSIAALEQEREIALGELTLRLRVDRIDRLADGRQLIIDYKSSNSLSVGAWVGARLEAPQLPLYGTVLEDEQPGSVAGLLFAQIRADKLRLIGLGDRELEAHAIQPSEQPWPQQLEEWRIALLMLADEYVNGRADVSPSSLRACQYCDLADVCRIGSAQLEDDRDNGERSEEKGR